MDVHGLKKAIALAGGQAHLATLLGKRQSVVWSWLNRDQKMSAEYVIKTCEALCWKVSPHEIRPDLYPHPDDGLPSVLRGRAA